MSVVPRDTRPRFRDYASVRGYVERVCFKTGPPGLVGTELEWIVARPDRPDDVVPLPLLQELLAAALPLPRGSVVTFEPGGQLELSSPPMPGPSACWHALREDADHVRGILAGAGLAVLPTALDPYRPPRRQLSHPRYDAMASYFDAIDPGTGNGGGTGAGPAMMNSTAATQVNLDAGADPADVARRWRLLHDVGPTLLAAFANSPVHAGADTGWKCGRQRIWQQLDPCRTAPVHAHAADAGTGGGPDPDPVSAFTDYALDARLMLRRGVGPHLGVTPGQTFRGWLEDGSGRDDGPGADDLDLHLSTLFPPVRPRGWFEVRYVDAQPAAWWPVPMAVLTALVDDPEAGAVAGEACRGLDDWRCAARDGLAAPGLRDAAELLFTAAASALRRSAEDEALVDLVTGFHDRYVAHGRSPADDLTLEPR